ncbi:hypothetical protein [Dactylosporangium sp. NPDC005555]|uniref:hypothetical protein n=1 Tax=Dactylosporangium sp. NPDC005555 TaxID=3154889 RepID=UPI0033BBB184
MVNADPTRLAEDVAAAADHLANCLATDVQIDPADVLAQLIQTARSLYDVADELGRAAVCVDQPAAAAARRAAHRFLSAATDLRTARIRLTPDYLSANVTDSHNPERYEV